MHSVHATPFLLGGGVEPSGPPTKFSKKGGGGWVDRISVFREVVGKEWGYYFQGSGVVIF